MVEINTPDSGKISITKDSNILDYVVPLSKYGLEEVHVKSKSFIFDVEACSNAELYLSSSKEMDSSQPLYRINLGALNNTKFLMSKRKDDSLKQGTMILKRYDNRGGRLSCSEFKSFWTTWNNEIIELGKGASVGKNILFTWVDPHPLIVRKIGLMTGWGSIGKWRILMRGKYKR